MASDPVFSPEDLELIERVAARIVELKLETPAILTLESARPLSVVAGQSMLFFEPIVTAFLRLPDYRRFARLIEDRDALELLTRRIEDLAETAHDARRRAKAEKPSR